MLLNILCFNICKSTLHPLLTLPEITSLYAPQGAEAAATNKIVVKNGKHAVKTKNIYIGGKVVDFDAVVKGKPVKDSKGTWKSSNKKIASVDKNGKVKALKNGKVTISFKTKATKKVKSVTVKMTINARTRASKMILTPAAVVVKEGEKATVGVSYEISKKIQAAGGKTTTYKLFAESSDEKAAKVSVEGDDKIVVEGVAKSATPVSITVYAAQVTNIAKAKEVRIKLTEKFDVKVNSKFDAKQVKANKILVTGTNLSTKAAAYVVKNTNGIVLNLKDKVEVNKEGTEATLEAVVNQIPEGKYTVTYDKEDPAEFTAVKQVLDKIVIEPADKAILVEGSENKIVRVFYKAFDNFGEDVTKEPLGANILANNKAIATKGAVELQSPTGFIIGTQTGVVLVDSNTGKSVTATLTISQYSMLSDIIFKGVYDKKDKKFVESIATTDDLKNYVMLFEGKDQYGIEMNSTKDVNAVIGGATALKADKLKDLYKVDGASYMAFSLGYVYGDKLNVGEATVQAFSTATGKQAAPAKINVISGNEVKTFTLGNGSKTIVVGEWNDISYTATDANGKPVTDIKALKKVKFTPEANLRWVEKAGKVILQYKPTTATTDKAVQEYVSFVTPSYNYGSALLTVYPTPMPQKIGGLKKDTATSVTQGSPLYITADKIVFKDQYGEDIDMSKLKDSYALKVSFGDGSGVFGDYSAVTDDTSSPKKGKTVASFGAVSVFANRDAELTAATKIVSASAVTPGSVAVTLSLIEKKSDGTIVDVVGSAYTFNIEAVSVSDIKNIRIEDIGLKKEGTAVNPEVTGEVDGKRVKLEPGKDYEIVDSTKNAPATGTIVAPATTGKAVVAVIIRGSGAELKKEYEYSNATPKVGSAELKPGDSGKLLGSADITADKVKDALNFKDQYGEAYTGTVPDMYVNFSHVKSDVDIENNGLTTAKIEAGSLVAGDTVRVKIVFSGSPYVFEGDIEIK